MADVGALEEQVQALETTFGAAAGMAAAFEGELTRMQESLVHTGREVNSLSGGISGGLRRAFDGLVFDGQKLSDALGAVGRSILDAVYATAARPVQNALGGFMAQGLQGAMSGLLPFAEGGAFSQGRVMPFAKGGVVTGPASFAMRSRRGLMGEAGPEAIMPLARGADGRLGVQAAGGGRAINVVINVTTPDVAGFQRSQGQVAAQVSRALARGQRNG